MWLFILKQFAKELATKIGGVKGYIVSKVLLYGGQYLIDLINTYILKKKRTAKNEEAVKKHEEVVNKPDSTLEERTKSYEDMVNNR